MDANNICVFAGNFKSWEDYLGYHLTGHNISVMKEKRTDDYHIFHVSDIFPYKK